MTSPALTRDVAAELRRIVGPGAVLTEPGELIPFESDALTAYRATPAAVVFVHDTEQVRRVVSTLHRARVPFVPRGAGTGLSGGALADGAVVIELARMNRILWVDAESQRARVQPGVLNTQLGAAVARHDLMYAPDPSSQTACTLGGNVAENSGGPHCLKYGVTANHVLALTVVAPNGEVLALPGPSSPGYDLVGLFVGSEGTLGICCEIEVRLVPRPAAVETLLAHFDEIDAAGRAVSAIIAAGIVPAALEMIDRETLRAVEASVFAAGFPTDVAASLIVELDGPAAGLAEQAADVEAILSAHGARRVARAESEADRTKFWQARKSAFGAMGRLGSDLLVQDATVPRSRLPEVLRRIYEIAREHDLLITNVFHAGDGNLHPNIPFDRRDPELTERVHAASRAIMKVCVEAGGTITGEHGVGVDKRKYMPLIYSEADLESMRWVKGVFDPAGLCNPGKMLPDGAAASPPSRRAARGRKDVATTIASALGSACLVYDRETFSIGGRPARAAAAPESVEELVELMKLARSEGWSVVPAGAGTWLSAGNPFRHADLVVTARRLNGPVEHHPDDLLATVPAGTSLRDLNHALAERDQWWPLDPLAGGSVGATIATASAGPLAAGYGTPRDLVLGLTVVRPDGRIVEAGGRVVKNVAGYDMVKLFTGSWGTLGVIAGAHLRLHTRPQTDRTRVFFAERGEDLAALAMELDRAGTLGAAAVEIASPAAVGALGDKGSEWLMAVRWLGHEAAVGDAIDAAGDAAARQRIRFGGRHGLWEKLGLIEERLTSALTLRLEVPLRVGARLIGLARPFLGGQTPALVASPPRGRVWIFVPGRLYEAAGGDRVWALRVADLRRGAEECGGSLRIERAPESLRSIADAWGDAGSTLQLNAGLKARFDPNGNLNPGLFVGGL